MTRVKINEMDRFVAARLKQIRLVQGLSMVALGKIVHTSYQQIQKYESGLNRISAATLWKLAEALECSVSDFFPNEKGLSRDFSAESRKILLKRFRSLLNEMISQENK